jgi:hypothetical protein
MNYNPYFPGGAISMARVLFDGLVDYDDSKSLSIALFRDLMHVLHFRNTCYDVPDGQGCRHILKLGSGART